MTAALTRLTRRAMLVRAALSVAATALPAGRAAAARDVHVLQAGSGRAAAVWRPLIERAPAALKSGLDLRFLGADPEQEAAQLLAGALDIGVLGPIRAAQSNGRRDDIVIFAPGLNNSGSWIVRDGKPYRAPRDLRGKRVAAPPAATETFHQARLAAALHGVDLKQEVDIVFGLSAANLARLERGEVEAVIATEPTATRLVARGAREIARIADMWQEATGDGRAMVLGGQSTRRDWLVANRAAAAQLARLYASVNEEIQAHPQILAELHEALGVPASERDAIALLPKRLAPIFPYEWDRSVFAVIDRELNAAVQSGLLARLPAKPVYAAA